MFYADVLGSGIPKAFVLSVETHTINDSLNTLPSPARFDLMQTYNWSVGDSSWKIAEVDSFAYGTDIYVQDITRDGKPDIVVHTHTDSTGDADGDGLAIWSAHDGNWKQIFRSVTGDPALQDIDNDSLPEIILHGYYAGMLPNTEAMGYVSDIYAFDGVKYSEAKNHYPTFFSDLVAQAKEKYMQAKTQTPISAPITDEVNFTLYKPCLQALAALRTSGDTSGARAFWESEKDYLSRMIPQEQFIDLQSFAETN
jgi:hypothetical protein